MHLSGKTLIAMVAGLCLLVAAPIAYASRGGDDDRYASRGGDDDRDDSGRNRSDDPRWALVNEQGRIIEQSGGFRIVNCYEDNNNCYIDINEDATEEGLGATIADQNNVSGQAPSLTGEIGVGACGIGVLNCAPDGTERDDVIVVTPRNSDGSETTEGTRKRFYVQVVGPDDR